jgi:hypothetical protein
MTLAAGQIELALAPMEGGTTGIEERLRPLVDRDLDRQAARLARDVGAQRQQVPALPGERRRLLLVNAADVDALLEADRPSVAVVGARVLPEQVASQVAEVVGFFLKRGWGIGSGGARGANAFALQGP